jgi:uncharacterized protein YkuJ
MSSYRITVESGQLVGLEEFEDGSWESERIRKGRKVFSYEDGLLLKTEAKRGYTKITTYADADGDGVFEEQSRRRLPGSPGRGRDRDDSSRGGSDDSSSVEDGYKFTLDDAGKVIAVWEYEDGRWEPERIGRRESFEFDGLNLIKAETKKSRVRVTTYSDADGDGIYVKSGRVRTDRLTGEVRGRSDRDGEDAYRFDYVDGQVVNLQEYEDGAWQVESVDSNESWAFDGVSLVQTETKRFGVEVSTYQDLNGDNIYTKISEIYSAF